jgi:hypothetical protein
MYSSENAFEDYVEQLKEMIHRDTLESKISNIAIKLK